MPIVQTVTDGSFAERVLEADRPVLVAFSAAWCPPCRALEPVLDGVARDFADRVRVVEIDVGTQPAIAARYRIMVVPTLMVFVAGRDEERESGLVSRERVLDLLARAGVAMAPAGAV